MCYQLPETSPHHLTSLLLQGMFSIRRSEGPQNKTCANQRLCQQKYKKVPWLFSKITGFASHTGCSYLGCSYPAPNPAGSALYSPYRQTRKWSNWEKRHTFCSSLPLLPCQLNWSYPSLSNGWNTTSKHSTQEAVRPTICKAFLGQQKATNPAEHHLRQTLPSLLCTHLWYLTEGSGGQKTCSVRLRRQEVSASLGLNRLLSTIRGTDSSHNEVDINMLG